MNIVEQIISQSEYSMSFVRKVLKKQFEIWVLIPTELRAKSVLSSNLRAVDRPLKVSMSDLWSIYGEKARIFRSDFILMWTSLHLDRFQANKFNMHLT